MCDLSSIERVQAEFMEKDLCILVDRQDKPIGCATKKDCHRVSAIRAGVALHRAFSVFLFNSSGALLLQQRSSDKVTFAGRWTNTCCSHPIYGTPDAQEDAHIGVKIAAVRKIEQELGINTLKVEDLHFLTRVHYCASSDAEWGEHEVDHILFAQLDVEFTPNPNEVSATRWVSQAQLQQLFDDSVAQPTLLTPWFKLIGEEFLLRQWWPQLSNILHNKGLGQPHTHTIYVLTQKGNQATQIPPATPGLIESPNQVHREV